jgi:hypothetical protein
MTPVPAGCRNGEKMMEEDSRGQQLLEMIWTPSAQSSWWPAVVPGLLIPSSTLLGSVVRRSVIFTYVCLSIPKSYDLLLFYMWCCGTRDRNQLVLGAPIRHVHERRLCLPYFSRVVKPEINPNTWFSIEMYQNPLSRCIKSSDLILIFLNTD